MKQDNATPIQEHVVRRRSLFGIAALSVLVADVGVLVLDSLVFLLRHQLFELMHPNDILPGFFILMPTMLVTMPVVIQIIIGAMLILGLVLSFIGLWKDQNKLFAIASLILNVGFICSMLGIIFILIVLSG